jgi:hypothetical protein
MRRKKRCLTSLRLWEHQGTRNDARLTTELRQNPFCQERDSHGMTSGRGDLSGIGKTQQKGQDATPSDGDAGVLVLNPLPLMEGPDVAFHERHALPDLVSYRVQW